MTWSCKLSLAVSDNVHKSLFSLCLAVPLLFRTLGKSRGGGGGGGLVEAIGCIRNLI